MEYTLTHGWGAPVCGYIENIEFARRPAGTPGVRRMSLEQPLYLQLLRPLVDTTEKKLTIVVFVVGGGFHRPKVVFRVPWMVRLAERGFVVAMPEYRAGDGIGYPEAVRDVRAAVRYMRQNGPRYGGDPDRIVLMGGSAGGTLALLAAYDSAGEFDQPEDGDVSARVSGVIDLYGMTDPTKEVGTFCSADTFANSACARMVGDHALLTGMEKVENAGVIRRIRTDRQLPPTMILHGTADTTIPLEQSRLLYDALIEKDQEADLYIMEGLTHADPVFFQEEMMERYAEFIRKVTKG